MTSNFGESIRNALVDLLSPLQEAAQDPRALIEWLATLGQTEEIAADPALLQITQHAATLVEKLSALDTSDLDSWTGIGEVLEIGREASDIQSALRQFGADPGRVHVTGALAEEVMALLLASYLRRRHRIFFRLASLLTLIEPRESTPLDPPLIENDITIRYPRLLDRLRFGSLNGLVSHPAQTLADTYLPHDMSAGVDAWSAAALLYPRLSVLADTLGLPWHTAHRPVVAAPRPPPSGEEPEDALLARVDPGDGEKETPPEPPIPDSYFATLFPTFRLTVATSASGPEADAAIELLASSAQHPGAVPGYLVRALGSFSTSVSSELWRLTLSATGEIPAFVLTRAAFSLGPDELPVSGGAARLLLERLGPAGSQGPDFVVGSTEGSRLELGSVSFEGGLLYDPSRTAAILSLNASGSSFVIAPRDGDGFVRTVLPEEGVKAGFDLGLAWSSDRGPSLAGAAGLETDLPLGVSIGGVVTVPTLHLSLKASDKGLQAEVSAAIGVSIGPVSAVIDRIGLNGVLTFPDDGGNFGPADLALDFKAPTGVGVTIDAVGVTGGGFLRYEGASGQYSGVVQLMLEGGIAVDGIGLIATRMPDGGEGYSLLVIITAKGFEPIPLPLGFRLTGIGGLLAVNRTFAEDALRAGLKNHALDSVMFPQDPIRNAPQILSNLNKVFPPATGSYLVGPMAQLEWGTPTLLTAQIAVVLEFGARLRLLVLAQITAILPEPKNDLIRLQLDAVGVVDFDQGTAAVDASLYDSRLLQKFVLTGDMALRLKWVAPPNFALAVGGLHPAFNPPPNFPKLERIAINLAAGDNPRIRCEAYLALTGSSIQFGARAELYASAAGFSIQGEIGFDVLIQRDPFAFLAEFYAQVQLKRGTTNLFKVRVEGALAGPRPLHVKAKATFEILWWDMSVRVDRTLVSGEPPPLPAPVDVLPLLLAALGLAGSWTARLPAGQQQGVMLRGRPELAGEILLHPLGRLTVSQAVVPLGMDISRFGDAAPTGARRFTIGRVTPEGQTESSEAVRGFFAPAQFFEMSDDEKLSRPSFESLPAGVSLGADAFAISANPPDWMEVSAIEFETIIVGMEPDGGEPPPPPDPYQLTAVSLGKQARFGAAANSRLRHTGAAKYRTTSVGRHRVAKEEWSIVATDDLTVQAAPGVDGTRPRSYSEAEQALRQLQREQPDRAADLTILRRRSEVGEP